MNKNQFIKFVETLPYGGKIRKSLLELYDSFFNEATTERDGLMSKEDKLKLDGIEEKANKYVHPTSSGDKHIPKGGKSGQVLIWSADGTAVWGNLSFNLSKATDTTLGGVKIGYATSEKNYAVQLDADGKMFVNVPWTDNNTTYAAATDSVLGLVKQAAKVESVAKPTDDTNANLKTSLDAAIDAINSITTNMTAAGQMKV